jgi:hypothetical protein
MKNFNIGFFFLTIHVVGLFINKIFNFPKTESNIYNVYYNGPIILRILSYVFFTLYFIKNIKNKLIIYILTIINLIILFITIKNQKKIFFNKNRKGLHEYIYIIISIIFLYFYMIGINDLIKSII